MLSPQEIQDINIAMLGLGAPIEKDGQGYNITDYSLMENIGMLAAYIDLSFEETYCTLSVLQHYKNTQLTDYKDELEKTFAYYKEEFEKKYPSDCLWKREQAIDDARNGADHTMSEYKHRILKYFGVKDKCAIVQLKEFIRDLDLKAFGAKWTKLDNDKFAIKVPFKNLDVFLDEVASIGRFGYEAPQELLDDLKKYNQEELEKEANNEQLLDAHLKPLNKTNSYGYDLYELDINDYDFNQKLWELKGKGLSYVDYKQSKTSVIISTNEKMLPNLLNFLKEQNVDVSLSENGPKKEDLNKSGNTLIDISQLELPFTPYPFQVEDAQTIVKKKRALLGHDMGCGKTFISALVGMSIPEKKLVICPETLRLNWKRELHNVDRNADIKVIYSKDKELVFGVDWTIMGYKTAVKFEKEILSDNFNCLFVDEAHKCKAVSSFGKPDSQQAKAVMKLSKSMEYTYLLTGTPIPSRNKDLYNLLVMLGDINDNKRFAFHEYGLKYCDAYNNGYGWDYTGNSNSEELNKTLNEYMTRRLKSDVLPDLKKQRIPIIIDTPLSKEYLNTEKRLHHMEDGDTYMGLAMQGRRLLSNSKADAAIDFAEDLLESGKSVVLVAEFNDTLDKMLEHFGDRACCIRGGMSDDDKQASIDAFQSGEKNVCCINLIAGGVGITLTKSYNMIICDFDWTPANMTQVEDRICRSGQTNLCNIFYICHERSLLDDVFIEMITDKSENIDRVVDNADNTVDLIKMRDDISGADNFISRLKKRIEDEKPRYEKVYEYVHEEVGKLVKELDKSKSQSKQSRNTKEMAI